MGTKGHKSKDKHIQQKRTYFDKLSATVSILVNRSWFNRTHVFSISFIAKEVNSNFTLKTSATHTVWSISKPTPKILKQMQSFTCASNNHDNALHSCTRHGKQHQWGQHSRHPHKPCMGHSLYPGAAIFGRSMLFDVPFLADWSKTGEYRQKQMDKNTVKENSSCLDWD